MIIAFIKLFLSLSNTVLYNIIKVRETFINQQTDELFSLIHTLYISGAQGVLLD